MEELLAERGLEVSYETVRRWVLKFRPEIARKLRRCRPRPSDRWQLDALRARGALFNAGVITRVDQVAGLMAEIEETTDNDIAEVAQSKAKFGAVEDSPSRSPPSSRFSPPKN